MGELEKISADLQEIKNSLLCTKRVLTFHEACRYTGLKASTLYKKTSSGEVPFSKPAGKIIFFDRVELENWLLSNKTTSAQHKEIITATYVTTKKLKKY